MLVHFFRTSSYHHLLSLALVSVCQDAACTCRQPLVLAFCFAALARDVGDSLHVTRPHPDGGTWLPSSSSSKAWCRAGCFLEVSFAGKWHPGQELPFSAYIVTFWAYLKTSILTACEAFPCGICVGNCNCHACCTFTMRKQWDLVMLEACIKACHGTIACTLACA